MGFFSDWIAPLLTTDFWSRIITRPLEAVVEHPLLAAKSAAVAGGTALAIGGAVLAAPIVGGAAVKVASVATNLGIVANATAPAASFGLTAAQALTAAAFFGGAVAEAQRLTSAPVASSPGARLLQNEYAAFFVWQ